MTARPLTLPVAALLIALLAAGCESRSDRSVARSKDPNRMSPTELHTFTAVNGATAAARAGQQELAVNVQQTQKVVVLQSGTTPTPPQPPSPPAPPGVTAGTVGPNGRTVIVVGAAERVTPRPTRPDPAIKLRVRSDKPHVSEEQATNDAIQVAQIELMKALQALDPPITVKPSMATIRSEYLRRESKDVIPLSEADKAELQKSGVHNPNRMYVEYDVELSDRQVQKLRSEERVNTAFQGGGVLLAVLLAVYGFLRLDAWTKGYLTSWLAIGAVGLVLVAVLAVLA